MLTQSWLIRLAVGFWFLSGSPSAILGVQQEDRSEYEVYVKVYRLAHADAESIAKLVRVLEIGAMITTDPSSQSVVVNTDRDSHQQIEALLSELDSPPRTTKTKTVFFPLKHRRAEDVGELVRRMITSPRTRVAVDEVNQVVIISGRTADIEAATRLVERVDRPQRSLQLSFFFIQGRIGAGSTDDQSMLPNDLGKVAGALKRNGFSNLSLLAPLSASVQENAHFSAGGMLATGGGARLSFTIEGRTHQGAESESAQVSIDARIRRSPSATSERWDTIFEVETTLTLKLGSYVVLAAAPSKNCENEVVALVVRAEQG